jgi:hypothetical protein
MMPRKDRHHRCAGLVMEYAAGGSLREAVNKGSVHLPSPAALQQAAAAAGLQGQDLAALSADQLKVLVQQLEQQLPLLPLQVVPSLHSSAPLPGGGSSTAAVPVGSQQGHGGMMAAAGGAAAAAGGGVPSSGRLSHEEQLASLRQPFTPLLRQLLLHIALGMQHLHAHGIVHGELRLDNVMVVGALPNALTLLLQQSQQQQQQKQSQQKQSQQPLSHQDRQMQSITSRQCQQQQQQMSSSSMDEQQQAAVAPSSGSRGEIEVDVPSCHGGNSFSTHSTLGSMESSSMMDSGQHSLGFSGQHSLGFSDSKGVDKSFFTLKLKDIGLCTINFAHHQVGNV